jgi:hypothetical protein
MTFHNASDVDDPSTGGLVSKFDDAAPGGYDTAYWAGRGKL